MDWLVILIVVLAVFLLIYIFYPSIKKMFSLKNRTVKSSPSKEQKQNERAVKKQEKLENKKKKKKEKQTKKENNLEKKIEIIENEGDLFSDGPVFEDDSNEGLEDPDTKVNYENFDLDGFFETESKDENIIYLKEEEQKE